MNIGSGWLIFQHMVICVAKKDRPLILEIRQEPLNVEGAAFAIWMISCE